jgi:hypothetical protein
MNIDGTTIPGLGGQSSFIPDTTKLYSKFYLLLKFKALNVDLHLAGTDYSDDFIINLLLTIKKTKHEPFIKPF